MKKLLLCLLLTPLISKGQNRPLMSDLVFRHSFEIEYENTINKIRYDDTIKCLVLVYQVSSPQSLDPTNLYLIKGWIVISTNYEEFYWVIKPRFLSMDKKTEIKNVWEVRGVPQYRYYDWVEEPKIYWNHTDGLKGIFDKIEIPKPAKRYGYYKNYEKKH